MKKFFILFILLTSIICINLIIANFTYKNNCQTQIDENNYEQALQIIDKFQSRLDVKFISIFTISHTWFSKLYYLEAEAAYNNNDLERAQKAYLKIINANNDQKILSHSQYNLGWIHLLKKNIKNTINDYQKSLNTDPNFKEAKHNLEIITKILDTQKKSSAGDTKTGTDGDGDGEINWEVWSEKNNKSKDTDGEKQW